MACDSDGMSAANMIVKLTSHAQRLIDVRKTCIEGILEADNALGRNYQNQYGRAIGRGLLPSSRSIRF
jgi:hypothetical protein